MPTGATADPPLRIVFPPNGARLEPAAGPSPEPVALKISGGIQPLTAGQRGAARDRGRPPASARGAGGPGFLRLTVMGAGTADSVVVRIQ
jgi:hypothetical protein